MVISKEPPKCIHMEPVVMTWEKRNFSVLHEKLLMTGMGKNRIFILKVMLRCNSVPHLLLFELHRVEDNYMPIK